MEQKKTERSGADAAAGDDLYFDEVDSGLREAVAGLAVPCESGSSAPPLDVEASSQGAKVRRRRIGQAVGEPGWLTHAEVCEYLRVDNRTIVGRMRETPPHIHRPWTNYGKPNRPYYRWQAKGVDPWWIEVNEWRTSRSETAGTEYGGGIRTGERGAGAARTPRPRRESGARSRPVLPSGSDGTLVKYVRSLNSPKS